MKKVKANSAFEIAANIVNCAEHGELAYAILFYDEAVAVMRNILYYDGVSVCGIDIHDSMYNNYDKEYLVSFDSDFGLNVEPAWVKGNEYHDAGYLSFEADVIFADGKANAKLLSENMDGNPIVVALDLSDCKIDEDDFEEDDWKEYVEFNDDEYEEECDEDDCECCEFNGDCRELTDEEKHEIFEEFTKFVNSVLRHK